MGLKSQVEYFAPVFEQMDDETEVASAAQTSIKTEKGNDAMNETINTQAAANQDAGVAAATAIAKAATTAPAAYAAPKFAKAFEDKENAIAIADVEMWHQAAPAITAEQGVCKHSKKGKLGASITFLIESFNMRFMVVPGSNDKEAKEKCRNSFDKQTISGESTTVEDYINALKAEGYPKADITKYVDVWGYVVGADKPEYVDQDELVRLQLSSTSSANFGYFCGQRGRAESSGRVPKLDTVLVTAEAQEGRNGSYTNFAFSAPKAK